MSWDRTAAEALVLRTVAAGRMGRHALRLALAELVLRGALQVEPGGRFAAAGPAADLPEPLVAVRDLVASRGEKGMTQSEVLRAVGGRWRSVDRWMDAEVVPSLAQAKLVMVWPSQKRAEVALTPAGREACDELDAELKVLRAKDGEPAAVAAAASAAGAAVLLADDAWRRLAELHALPDVLTSGVSLPAGSLSGMHDAGTSAVELVLALLAAVFGAGS